MEFNKTSIYKQYLRFCTDVWFFHFIWLQLAFLFLKLCNTFFVIDKKRKKENEKIKLPRTRSKTEQYDKTMCIICQNPGGRNCKVKFKETGRTMLSVAQKLSDKSFFVQHNKSCWWCYRQRSLIWQLVLGKGK